MAHSGLLDLLFPRRCVGCGREEGGWLCAACEASVERLAEPLGATEETERVITLLDFERPVVREALHNLKYNGITELAGGLTSLVARRYGVDELRRLVGQAVLIPVPVSSSRRKQRGFNQAEELAQALGSWLGLPVWSAAVRRVRQGKTVVGSSGTERRHSAHGFAWSGLAVPPPYADRPWVVVDDILTTGATLAACIRVLQPHSPTAISGLVMAAKR